MAIETEFGPVLTVEAHPWGRGEAAFMIGFAVFVSLVGVPIAASILTSGRAASRGEAVAAVAAALLTLVAGPSVVVAAVREFPRGTWRLDAEGVTHSTRRRMRQIRWKDVEWVRWRSDVVTLKGGGKCVRVTLGYIEEPAWSAVHARLEATLGKEFDLYRHPVPDAFDAVEPAWLRPVLRAARVVILGVVLGAALAGLAYWIGTRYPEKDDHFPQMAVMGLLACLLIPSGLWIIRVMERTNPTWRRRCVKPPAADLLDPW